MLATYHIMSVKRILKQSFGTFGQIESVSIVKDKYSGESRGFGFVKMPVKNEAQLAIDGLNGKDLKGKSLNVNEARFSIGQQP